jgi:hypothetical protein
MKTSILKKMILLVVVLTVAPVPVAWAQFGGSNQGGKNSFFDELVVPKAPGRSMNGTLDISGDANGFFLVPGEKCLNGTVVQQGDRKTLYTFTFNFRVMQGSIFKAFSHSEDNLCSEDIGEAAAMFQVFVNTTVVPAIFPGGGTAVLKAYKNLVQSPVSTDGQTVVCCDGREWIMLDMEFAVK